MKRCSFPAFILAALGCAFLANASEAPWRALIIDGQNNHAIWPKSTVMMKRYLEENGAFEVDVYRTRYTWRGGDWIETYPLNDGVERSELPEPKTDDRFVPDFSSYDVVVSNFGWKTASWPEETNRALEAFVRDGGGFVSVHAANNSFPEWLAYNRMIGLGGWGERNERHGPYVYYDEKGALARDESPGSAGSHGPEHVFGIKVRESDHPIMRGIPDNWLHAKDELYAELRGPAENMTILATAYSDPALDKGTGRHEPVLMAIDYGEGRVFHTTLGHTDYSLECVGFIVTFQRGVEWAASGDVAKTDLPEDFPAEEATSSRRFEP